MNAHSLIGRSLHALFCRHLKKNITMEEQRFCGSVLEGLDSSELYICGGVSAEFNLGNIVALIRKIMDFLDDYIPSLINGFKDGYDVLK